MTTEYYTLYKLQSQSDDVVVEVQANDPEIIATAQVQARQRQALMLVCVAHARASHSNALMLFRDALQHASECDYIGPYYG